ncbi:hypothetical protein M2175_005333 [Bradyrhizobium elkanii]|uniref:hypothetical protein n=1 Tax=Bradyrhizobium TaxID=374 RepID=UPI0021690B22|nr:MULTISPECIES: hypothetical protein [Bradyrhizobium]MCS3930302.1 hypothetical protein [Bradyrhizobium elkanii]MCS3970859.1 hypothetical protein [Bradyrhizobium japonicum]
MIRDFWRGDAQYSADCFCDGNLDFEHRECIGILDELSMVRPQLSDVRIERRAKGNGNTAIPHG